MNFFCNFRIDLEYKKDKFSRNFGGNFSIAFVDSVGAKMKEPPVEPTDEE